MLQSRLIFFVHLVKTFRCMYTSEYILQGVGEPYQFRFKYFLYARTTKAKTLNIIV